MSRSGGMGECVSLSLSVAFEYDRMKPKLLLLHSHRRFINFRVNVNGAWCRHSIYTNTMYAPHSLSQRASARFRYTLQTACSCVEYQPVGHGHYCVKARRRAPGPALSTIRKRVKEEAGRETERRINPKNEIIFARQNDMEFQCWDEKARRTRSHIVSLRIIIAFIIS